MSIETRAANLAKRVAAVERRVAGLPLRVAAGQVRRPYDLVAITGDRVWMRGLNDSQRWTTFSSSGAREGSFTVSAGFSGGQAENKFVGHMSDLVLERYGGYTESLSGHSHMIHVPSDYLYCKNGTDVKVLKFNGSLESSFSVESGTKFAATNEYYLVTSDGTPSDGPSLYVYSRAGSLVSTQSPIIEAGGLYQPWIWITRNNHIWCARYHTTGVGHVYTFRTTDNAGSTLNTWTFTITFAGFSAFPDLNLGSSETDRLSFSIAGSPTTEYVFSESGTQVGHPSVTNTTKNCIDDYWWTTGTTSSKCYKYDGTNTASITSLNYRTGDGRYLWTWNSVTAGTTIPVRCYDYDGTLLSTTNISYAGYPEDDVYFLDGRLWHFNKQTQRMRCYDTTGTMLGNWLIR